MVLRVGIAKPAVPDPKLHPEAGGQAWKLLLWAHRRPPGWLGEKRRGCHCADSAASEASPLQVAGRSVCVQACREIGTLAESQEWAEKVG